MHLNIHKLVHTKNVEVAKKVAQKLKLYVDQIHEVNNYRIKQELLEIYVGIIQPNI